MNLTTAQQYKLKKFIKELEQYKARHTELISVYISSGYDLNKIMNHLNQEQGTASNIKSKSTKDNVITSLEKMMQHLKLFKKTPNHGLAVFSGNVAEREGQQEYKVWSIEPPIPLKQRLYRCDKEFMLNPLRDMLKTKDIYGLVVLDRRDASVALLKGKTIVPLIKTHSHVPGKMKAGGQCHVFGTLVQSASGSILKIENCHNPINIKSVVIKDYSIKDSPITDKWVNKKQEIYKIKTKHPLLTVECSKDHLFLVLTENGVIEKPAEELRKGDTLLTPEKIDVKGTVQRIDSKKYTNQKHHQGSTVKLPVILNKEFAQFLGYYIGDGCSEIDRITFFEQDKQVALNYQKKFNKFFNTNSSYKFRESKNYHQIKFTSRPLVRLIKNEFPELKKTLDSEIPRKILESSSEIVAGFLRGFFDAEGCVYNKKGVSLGVNNKKLAQQIQLTLLRFSILNSLQEYDNRANKYSNNPRFTIDITEKKSLQLFKKHIGFTSSKKDKKLSVVINNKSERSYTRQIIIPGKKIRKIIEKAGYNLQLFPKVNNFFRNERMMSKEAFKNSILKNIKDKELYNKLKEICSYPILPVKINKIKVINKPTKMIDISVKNKNFVANGIIVHNSAARFARLREGAIKDHFKKVAEHIKNQFLGEKLKGIIIGGPGPTKYDFIKGEYLTGDIKKKVIAIKDIAYTGDFGLQELLDKSSDVLAKEDVIKERRTMERFFELLSKKPNMVSYGMEEVKKNLEIGAVELLLLSEDLEEKTVDEFDALAKKTGTEVKIISTETREGVQLRDIGKVAAILRYEIE